MFNLKSKIDARLEARRNGESGLALLDVLLGMAIFALIAVIAVQAMGQFRERAYITQATSDAKQVATGIEAAMTSPNATFPTFTAAGATSTELSGIGANKTGSNTVLVSGTYPGYTICVVSGGDSRSWAKYEGSAGKITGSGKATAAITTTAGCV